MSDFFEIHILRKGGSSYVYKLRLGRMHSHLIEKNIFLSTQVFSKDFNCKFQETYFTEKVLVVDSFPLLRKQLL